MMPPWTGSYPARPRCGLTHTTAVRDRGEPAHLLAESLRALALPAVAEDHDDGAAGHPAPAPAVEEDLEALGEAGAPGPVRHRLRRGDDGPVGVALLQRPGDVGQAGAEGEDLGGYACGAVGVRQAGSGRRRMRSSTRRRRRAGRRDVAGCPAAATRPRPAPPSGAASPAGCGGRRRSPAGTPRGGGRGDAARGAAGRRRAGPAPRAPGGRGWRRRAGAAPPSCWRGRGRPLVARCPRHRPAPRRRARPAG